MHRTFNIWFIIAATAFAISLSGCATDKPTFSAPISNIAVTQHLAKAASAAKVTTQKAQDAAAKGLVAKSPEAVALVASAQQTEIELKLTQEANTGLTQDILIKNISAQDLTDQLSYIVPKYQASVSIIWKWRLLAIGEGVAITALLFWIFKKPIMGAAAFIAGRFAGVPSAILFLALQHHYQFNVFSIWNNTIWPDL